MKKLFLIILFLGIYSNVIFSQEIIHPFMSGGKGSPKVDEFIRRGLNLGSCADIKKWVDELNPMVNGEYGRQLSFAQLSNSGNKQALGVITQQIEGKLKTFNCDANGNSISSKSGGGQSGGGGQSIIGNNGNSFMDPQLLAAVLQRRQEMEEYRQSFVVDYKGPNKYAYINDLKEDPNTQSDVLVLNNDSKLKIIVVKITEDQLMYKKAILPDGPTFSIKLSNVKKVIYLNGKEQIFPK